MNWLYKLERKHPNFGVPNLMMYISSSMLVVFVMSFLVQMPVVSWIIFDRALILQGEIWRIFTFAFIPPGGHIFFTVIALYLYYIIGNSLERSWGTFLFTAYYFIGVLGTVVAGFIAGGITNIYLNMSLFFAFAMLYPDHQMLLFFIIPIKIKYLAYFNAFFFALSLGVSILERDWITSVSIIFSLINFFLFFGGDIMRRMRQNAKYSKRRRDFRQQSNRNMWR